MSYAVKTQDAIRHVMSKHESGVILDSYQITDLIRKSFGKKEKYQTVGRQLRRMTNEESSYHQWLIRVEDNKYLFVDNPTSLYALTENDTTSLKEATDQELVDELKKRLKR